MELIKLTNNTYYLKGPVNIGLIKTSQGTILVDTGIDKNAAKTIEKILKQKEWNLTHIINTHAHADHFGGSQYLKEKYQAKVFAPKIESVIMEHPSLEPFYLFGGAHPIKELKNKFLQAPPVTVDHFLEKGPINISDKSLEIVSLPGHTMGQIGVVCENTFYLADSVFGSDVLEKHGIPYFVDIDLTLKTLDYLETLKFKYYVPAHGEITSNIKSLTVINRQYIYKITNQIRQLLPGSTEEILLKLLNSLNILISNPGQYYLLKAAMLSHISYLNNTGEITWEIEANSLKWKLNTKSNQPPVKK